MPVMFTATVIHAAAARSSQFAGAQAAHRHTIEGCAQARARACARASAALNAPASLSGRSNTETLRKLSGSWPNIVATPPACSIL